MSKVRLYARNLLANWVGYFANLLVMFFLSPFIVGTLGEETYGVWSLLVSLTGYLGLVQMGTEAGLGRYVNYYLGRREIHKVNGILNTALAFFLVAGVVLLAAAGGLAMAFETLFTKVSADLVAVARPALILVAVNLWMSFLGAAFEQVLRAFERFDLANGINLVVLAIRTVGTVVVLKAGGGLVPLAWVQVLSSVVGVLAAWLCARRIFPQMRIRPGEISAPRFKELFGFSIWAFISQIAMKLMYWTDTVVIAILLGPAMVTYYTLPLQLIQYGRGVVDNMVGVLGPQTIQASSVGNYHQLRKILGWGSKVIMFLAIPLFVGMIFFGREFFVLWMGKRFSVSGSVLILLAIPQLVVMGVRPCVNIVNGLGRVRFGAAITLAQGLVNLGLTLLYVMYCDLWLYGVALGTLVPAVIFNVVVVAVVLRWIRFPTRIFFGNHVLRWVLAAVLFGVLCQGIAMLPGQEVWGWFFLKVLALLAISMPLGWYVIFTGKERVEFAHRLARVFRRSGSSAEDAS